MTQQESLLEAVPFTAQNKDATGKPGTSIAEILIILSQRKRIVFFSGLIFALAAAITVHFLRDSFTAEAVILPPQQQQSSLAALASGAMGSLGGGGIAAQIGLKSPADLFIGILRSRTISDDMINRFKLREVYKTKLASSARLALKDHTSFTSGKDSLLSISVEDHDPKRAAAMANAFIEELYKQNSRLIITDAAQRRFFFEQRLRREKDELSDSEIAFTNTQTATGLVMPAGQVEVLIRSAAQLRAEISVREVSLQAVGSYATDDNPQIQVLKREISALHVQLTQLENKGSPGSSLEVSGGTLPAAGLAYLRKARDVKYHETLYELLSKQYEAALMDEARQSPLIQVVDEANVPDHKSGPRRTILVLRSGLLGMVLASIYVVAAHIRALRFPAMAVDR